MQIFHLNLFFAGQDFSTPYMADDLDLFDIFGLVLWLIDTTREMNLYLYT